MKNLEAMAREVAEQARYWGEEVAPVEPLSPPVGGGNGATVTHAELVALVGGPIAGVVLVSAVAGASAELSGGKSFPSLVKLSVGKPRTVILKERDKLRLYGPHAGEVRAWVLIDGSGKAQPASQGPRHGPPTGHMRCGTIRTECRDQSSPLPSTT